MDAFAPIEICDGLLLRFVANPLQYLRRIGAIFYFSLGYIPFDSLGQIHKRPKRSTAATSLSARGEHLA